MNRLAVFGILLLLGITVAREITTIVPDLALEEEEIVELEDEPDSAENTVESESASELLELIERVSLQLSTKGELKRFRSNYWETWVAPYNISTHFPYYLSGYDDENRPIWVVEFGKWDIRGIVMGGNETLSAFDKYVYQGIYRIYRSFVDRSTPDRPVTEFNVILDFDGYPLTQVAHIETIVYILGLFRRFHDILDRHMSHAYFINVSFVAERFVSVLRPVVGAVAERLDVYGTRRDKWMHALTRHFPKNQLPEWYGGERDFVPIRVYG